MLLKLHLWTLRGGAMFIRGALFIHALLTCAKNVIPTIGSPLSHVIRPSSLTSTNLNPIINESHQLSTHFISLKPPSIL